MLLKFDNPSEIETGIGIIAGSAVNQDGRSSSLTAPNGPSQKSIICSAWEAASESMALAFSLQVTFRPSSHLT